MAEIYYHELPSLNEMPNASMFRVQKKVGANWRDYKFDALGRVGRFVVDYDVAALVIDPNATLGPAAPTGYGYSILPWSWAAYLPGPGHVDGSIKILFYDATASDVVRETTFLLRLGDIVYNTIASAISNVDNDLSEQYQLNMNAPFLAGDGTLRVCIYYTLIPI